MSNPKMINKGFDYKFVELWLGTGLIISNGQKWFERRKALTTAFHFQILEDFVDVFDKQANILINKLKGSTETIDITKDISMYALDVICGTYS